MGSGPDDVGAVAARLADHLDDARIPYALGGALALAAHGVARMTADVDLGVFIDEERLDDLFGALERAGCLFERGRVRADVERMSLFTVRCGRVLVDVFVAFDPHDSDALERRVSLPGADGRARWFLSAEDLAVHKLALLRPKDLADLERLFAAAPTLDVAYVRRWVDAITGTDEDPRHLALADLTTRFCPR